MLKPIFAAAATLGLLAAPAMADDHADSAAMEYVHESSKPVGLAETRRR